MVVYEDISVSELRDRAWSGAVDTLKYLSDDEIETVFNILSECYEHGFHLTDLNDFFWFEDDTIAEWLGYKSFDEIMNR